MPTSIPPAVSNTRLLQLQNWIRQQYAGRRIRISGEPCFSHLAEVAETAERLIPLGYEIGLCHDLLEDTGMSPEEFCIALQRFGYRDDSAREITRSVIELTDVYTATAFPELSKRERKRLEEERLVLLSAISQTVKYADLIYNAKWTARYKPEKALKYLRKKRKLLNKLDRGDPELRREAILAVQNCLNLFR